MKKIFCILVALTLLFVNALACDGIIPTSSDDSFLYSDCSYWVIDERYNELIGMISPLEAVPVLPVQNVTYKAVRGFSSTGIIRVKGRAQFIMTDTAVAGLTCLNNVTIKLYPAYYDIVAEVTNRRVGGGVCAQTIVASTLWKIDNTVAHIFYTNQIVFAVGIVYFNGGRDHTILWCGDFDGDGLNELGFKAGVTDFKPTPSPAPTRKPSQPQPPSSTPKPCTTPKPCNPCNPCETVIKFCFQLCIQVKTCITTECK